MTRCTIAFIAVFLVFPFSMLCEDSQAEKRKLAEMEQALRNEVPHLLCLERNIATGGQPSQGAYAKLASNGFRSVLNLRTAQEGVNLEEEKEAVEKAGMRYVNIPVDSSALASEQVNEFLNVVKDRSMQPILIHCATANRVGAFWLIYRVLEQGWSQEKALEEATRIGLTSPRLRTFALEYLASQKR